MEFVKLTNDIAVPSAIVTLMLADLTLDTAGRDCSFKVRLWVSALCTEGWCVFPNLVGFVIYTCILKPRLH